MRMIAASSTVSSSRLILSLTFSMKSLSHHSLSWNHHLAKQKPCSIPEFSQRKYVSQPPLTPSTTLMSWIGTCLRSLSFFIASSMICVGVICFTSSNNLADKLIVGRSAMFILGYWIITKKEKKIKKRAKIN